MQHNSLEYVNPNTLTLVTKALLKQHPEWSEQLEKYYSISADEGAGDVFVQQVKETGFIHTPLFVEEIPDLNLTVIVAGRKRYLAAKQLGFTEIPVLYRDEDSTEQTVILEATENLARRNLNVRELGEHYRKLFLAGLNQEKVAKLTGKTPAYISQILSVAEMPEVVHKAIDSGKLSTTAAYGLRTLGEKAPKASGRQRIYDPKKVKEAIESMAEEAKLAGGGDGKIKVRQANSSNASANDLSKKNWIALFESADTPDDYKALIGCFIGKLSMKQAKEMAEDNLDWLVKIEPQPKPRKVKEPKVKADKKGKKPSEQSDDDLMSMFPED